MRTDDPTHEDSKRRRRIAVLALGLAVAGATGVAYAYWTADGQGDGTAATGTTTAITVNQTSVVTGLRPGGPAVALSGDFDNPAGNGTVKVGTLTVTISGISGNPGTCTTADYTLSGGTVVVNQDLAEGSGVGSWSGPTLAMNNTLLNQDGCKGATVELSYSTTTA